VLRSIPDKLGGVVGMLGAIVIIAVLPLVDTSVFRSAFFKPFHRTLFWFFVCNSLVLGWIGQMPVETPFAEIGLFVSIFYFVYFLVILPFLGFLETRLVKTALNYTNLFFFNFIHYAFF
jgi:ubiquinol-cytochrome c reductase cytochrome b subunit